MWGWREDTRSGGWRFDAANAWTWHAVPRHEWVDEPTPIFRAVALEWERRRRENVTDHRTIVDTADERGFLGPPPEPRPASEPMPVQRPGDTRHRRSLALVGSPTPPLPRSGPEDEPSRRAQDRRPPLAATTPARGRHAQPREENNGLHELGFVTLTPRR